MKVNEAERCYLMVSTALQALYNSGIKLEEFNNQEMRIKIRDWEATRLTLEQYFQTYRDEEQ